MTTLRQSLEDYLALRRGVGYKLEDTARILASFVAFAEQAGAGTVTTELALAWATQPQHASPIWRAHRLSAVRGFARYLHALDTSTEIPPAGLLVDRTHEPRTIRLLRSTPTAPRRSFSTTTSQSANTPPHRYSVPHGLSAWKAPFHSPTRHSRAESIGVCLPTFHTAAADQVHVASTPGTAWPVHGFPPDSSRAEK